MVPKHGCNEGCEMCCIQLPVYIPGSSDAVEMLWRLQNLILRSRSNPRHGCGCWVEIPSPSDLRAGAKMLINVVFRIQLG